MNLLVRKFMSYIVKLRLGKLTTAIDQQQSSIDPFTSYFISQNTASSFINIYETIHESLLIDIVRKNVV